MRIRNVEDVAGWRLCLGCGACAYGCPEKRITLVDILNDGIRPFIEGNGCGSCSECVKFCPGCETTHDDFEDRAGIIPELARGWGPVLEVWEGYAKDPEVRYRGSSGGLASALAIFCVEEEGMSGVLHTGADNEAPWRNRTVFSRSRGEILSNAGSRYSPASPCEGLSEIERAPSPSVFIGKPCDVAALRKAQAIKPELKDKTGLAISIFCAGTPSSMGTLKLLDNFNIEPSAVTEMRYRGNGWPGNCTATVKKENHPALRMSYTESWGFLQKFRPFRCYLCPDGAGEFADISCGDPWHRKALKGEKGHSLVIVRTEAGRRVLHRAIEAGHVVLDRAGPAALKNSQPNLLEKRSAVWGRLLALRLFFIPAPKLNGFQLFSNWTALAPGEKLKSVLGTVKRIIRRRYFKKTALRRTELK